MSKILLISFGCLLTLASCFYSDDIPEDQQTWEYDQPSNQQMSDDALLQLDLDIKDGFYESTNSLIIIKNDKLVFENYYDNGDRTKTYNVGQVAMGWTSAFFGKVLNEELNGNLDIPISNILTDYAAIFDADPLKQEITVRHVLEMRTGLAWNELIRLQTEIDSDVRLAIESEDPVRFLLEKPMEAPAGARFAYNTASTLLLIKVMERVVNQPITDYLNDSFFNPIGVQPIYTFLNDGTPNIPWGLELTALDAAKVNFLIFKKGNWFGNQLIPEDWINEITQTKITLSAANTYGYLWRTFGPESFVTENYGTDDIFFQYGDFSQAVFFSESRNMMVSVNADNLTGNFANFSFWIYVRVLDSGNLLL